MMTSIMINATNNNNTNNNNSNNVCMMMMIMMMVNVNPVLINPSNISHILNY
jgi:hypothetical protein